MTNFSFMLWPDGSWCETAGATDFLKETAGWIEVAPRTRLITIANVLTDEKELGSILQEMFG